MDYKKFFQTPVGLSVIAILSFFVILLIYSSANKSLINNPMGLIPFLLITLFFISILLFVTGLIFPKLLLWWHEDKSVINIVKTFGLMPPLIFILLILSMSDSIVLGMFFVLIALFIVGLAQPKLVIRWGKNRTRSKALITYGLVIILFFVTVRTINTMTSKSVENTVVTSEEEYTDESSQDTSTNDIEDNDESADYSSEKPDDIDTANDETDSSSDEFEEEVSTSSLEYKLATLDAGYEVDTDDEKVQQFADLLDSIDSKTENSKQEIADITVKAQEILGERGTNIGLLDVMNNLNDSIPEESKDLNFKEVAAALTTLMKNE